MTNGRSLVYQWILLAVAISFSSGVRSEELKITLLSPEPPTNLFWGQVIDFARAVAEDLDITLDVVCPSEPSNASSYVIKRSTAHIMEPDYKSNFILTPYWDNRFVSRPDFRVFLFNIDFTEEERGPVGHPREKYPNWIGHMHPDDTRGGSDLAEILVQNAKAGGKSNKQSIIALAGSIQSQVSEYRVEGLRQRIDGDRNLTLNHIYNTTWTRKNANDVLERALKSYPDTTIVWTVSDELALGGLQVLKASGKKPGQDVFVGSFDWSVEGLQAVKNGDIAASMGGHFMEAGWALVLLYDYHNKKDFKDDTGVEIVTSMEPVTKDNIDIFLQKFGKRNWNAIDFRKFTKTSNPALKSYDFSLDAILASMESSG